jgi:prevent-host-death family protein
MATKTISAWEGRRNCGKVLNEVTRNHQQAIVESHGEPATAVVPLHILQKYQEDIVFFL